MKNDGLFKDYGENDDIAENLYLMRNKFVNNYNIKCIAKKKSHIIINEIFKIADAADMPKCYITYDNSYVLLVTIANHLSDGDFYYCVDKLLRYDWFELSDNLFPDISRKTFVKIINK